MYYNKRTLVRSDRIQMISTPEEYDVYLNYIDELDSSVRFEKYYFASPALATNQYKEELKKLNAEHKYEVALPIMINDMILSEDINNDLEQGNTCIIFDMGTELVEEEIYRAIDAHFGNSKFHNNVKYWTMYENCDWKGTVEIVSASRTALRYGAWDYATGLELGNPDFYKDYISEVEDMKPKHFLSLNRRMRSHRILLMAELIKRDIDIADNFYLSFLGDRIDGIAAPNDVAAITNTFKYHHDTYDKSICTKLWKDWYGQELPYNTNVPFEDWFGSSNLDRVTEMFPFRQKTYVEIVTEYTAKNDGLVSITEKLPQTFLSKKPFIIVGDAGFLKQLKKLGFKTFDKFWSEEYDTQEWAHNRIQYIGTSIEEIQNNISIETDEVGNIVYGKEMQEILEHNYNHYKYNYVCDVDNRILQSLLVGDKLKMKPGLAYNEVDTVSQDDLWYSENTNVAIVPPQTNFMLDKIVSTLGFKLISSTEIDLKKTRIISFTQDPRKRFYNGIVVLANSLNKTPEEILERIMNGETETLNHPYLQLQTHLNSNYDIYYTIDLDNAESSPYDKDIGIVVNEIVAIVSHQMLYKSHLHTKTEFVRDLSRPEFNKLIDSERVNNFIFDFYKDDFVFYFTYGSWRNTKSNNIATLRGKFEDWLENFSEEQVEIIEYFKDKGHANYFDTSLNKNYWINHCMFIDNIGLNYAPKDIKILDMGTHFGFTPQFLKSEGFVNVDSTNSFKEAGSTLSDLKKMWKLLDLNPMNVHVRPNEHFKLDKKYDVIFATMSNIFWRTERVIKFAAGNVSQDWSIIDENGTPSTFFVPYEKRELDFFIKNIMEYLEPGGIAVIQPYPYVYNKLAGFEEERILLQQFQNSEISYEYPQSTNHTPTAELSNYFVVQKMK
jgi:hypothetical protein|tara:strand:- start:558 stop:3230 length:2673 start_codon:yes stop_codon:yes gene_type:complete